MAGQRGRRDDQYADHQDRENAGPEERGRAIVPGLPVVVVELPAGHGADSSGDMQVSACSAELRDDLCGEEVHVVEI